MSGLRSRIGATFLVPRGADGAGPAVVVDRVVADSPPAADVVVLSRPADAWVAGAAVALGSPGGSRRPAALVAVWGAPRPALQAPAAPRARRLATRLAERGHDVRVTGRLVLAAPGDDVGEGVRLAATVADLPVVRVFAGPRGEAVDEQLDLADRVVVVAAGGEDAVAGLAAARLGARARILRMNAPAAVRTLAVAGVGLRAPLRAAVDEALA